MVKQRRSVNGVLLLDKPSGITSHTAVSRAKALYNAAKVGHTGTLDPMATGLLPLAFGEATKFCHVLLNADKSYTAAIRLGMTTTTGDLEGDILVRSPVAVDLTAIERALSRFRGDVMQIPPMYSALKHAGKPLYEYARAGTEVHRTPRQVCISSLELQGFVDDELRLSVSCSKGTYIRVLAQDIGSALGCGATLTSLNRTRVGQFTLEHGLGVDALGALSDAEREARLLPVDVFVDSLPKLELNAFQVSRMTQGQSVEYSPVAPRGLARVYGPGSAFLGIAEAVSGGWLKPRRLVATRGPAS